MWNNPNAKFPSLKSWRYVFNFNKQTTLLNYGGVGLSKWHICGRGLNRYDDEGMKDISKVKFYLKTNSRNVNI